MSDIYIDPTTRSDIKSIIVDMFSLEPDSISNELIDRAIRWVQSEIASRGFILADYLVTDWKATHWILFESALWMSCEFLSNSGLLFFRPGEVSEEQLGRLRLAYNSSQSRVFLLRELPTGLSAERLISHDTYRMLAFSCIDKFYLEYRRGDVRKYNAMCQSTVSSDSTKYWE